MSTMNSRIIRTAGTSYGNPYTNKCDQRDHVQLDPSTLTTKEVDASGYLKPGVPLQQDGTLVDGIDQVAYGVTPEALKLPLDTIPPTDVSLAAETVRPLIGVGVGGVLNRDIIEENLGRALSANELAALALGGFKVTLT
jgi:hypothetical protein